MRCVWCSTHERRAGAGSEPPGSRSISTRSRTTFGALRPDGADLMAVVKADGYGHGAVQVAGAALEGGAAWLGVALVEEGLALRRAGIDAPILVLSEFPAGTERAALDAQLTPSLYTRAALQRLHDAAAGRPRVGVHVKIDTGMHRVGVWPPDELTAFLGPACATAGSPWTALWTHLASSEDDAVTTKDQLDRFQGAVMAAAGGRPRTRHAPRREHRGFDPVSGSAAGHGARRDRDLRRGTGAGRRRRARAAPRDGLAFHGHHGRSGSRWASASATGIATSWTVTRGSPRCRWATPTAILARCPPVPMS